MTPTQSDASGLVTWWMASPRQACSPGSPSGLKRLDPVLDAGDAADACRATSVSGSSAATITKNWSTSL